MHENFRLNDTVRYTNKNLMASANYYFLSLEIHQNKENSKIKIVVVSSSVIHWIGERINLFNGC